MIMFLKTKNVSKPFRPGIFRNTGYLTYILQKVPSTLISCRVQVVVSKLKPFRPETRRSTGYHTLNPRTDSDHFCRRTMIMLLKLQCLANHSDQESLKIQVT